ncbi:MAG TPA: MotA/TolQ/ExbB proton channel family protein [Polyangiaceae bacterium]|jgi:biopolymer transport protein ExbB
MDITDWLQKLMIQFGARWVMWLLVGLSVISVAIMLERGWFYFTLRDDLGKLAVQLRDFLKNGDLAGARKRLGQSPCAEAAVVSAGLDHADRGARAAEEAMAGAAALQRIKLERRLAFLGTLGNNAPFIGLFGTVIGVVDAFAALAKQDAAMTAGKAQAMAPAEVMAAIAEALVATAIGLAVAIPAVVMYNWFQRHSKSILANTEALSRVLLAHLVAVDAGLAPALRTSGEAEFEPKKAKG